MIRPANSARGGVGQRDIFRSKHGVLYARRICALAVPALLTGCGQGGAPSFSLFGAFFPSWLLCSVLGIIAAFLARIIFVANGMANVLPFQLLVCTSIGVLCGALIWLLFFG